MAERSQKTKIAVIGGGPAGIFTLRALQTLDYSQFEVQCFERYSQIGGMWNFTGVENLEDDGLERHSAMYHNLRTNNPKYVLETPEFSMSTSEDTRCYVDAETVLTSLKLFAEKFKIQEKVSFNCWIENVAYDEQKERFQVEYKNLKNGRRCYETFDYVIVAVGHFRYPNMPNYPGQETFPGKTIHSRDFLDGRKFQGKRVLVVGASYSGEDIAIQSLREGASQVTISNKGYPTGSKWPKGIEEKPILTKIDESVVIFSDGTKSEYDAIIYCTGYNHEFPFLDKSLCLKSKNVLVPPLYKQVVMPTNKKLFYIGMQNQVYSFSMFWLQGQLCAKVIQGKLLVPSIDDCLDAIKEDQERENTVKSIYDAIKCQTEYLDELTKLTDQVSMDQTELLHQWVADRTDDISTYKEKLHFKSKFYK